MESRGFVASSSIPVFSSIFGMCCLWQRLVVIFVVGAAEILAGAGDGFGGRRDRSHGASAGFAGILKHPYPGKIVAPVFPLLLPGDGSLSDYLCDIPTVSLGGHLPGPPPDLQTFSSDCTVASLGSDICIPFSALNFLLFLWAGRQ
ncbi:uncharacterized protein LOC142418961 isoform X6 [Mycteria americana]|uniref:uncharacterized protein LOC142418961 isoform X6 n=1 Tax=Mycteria americana TaxID=33587 RepID=UPI003F58D84C